MQATKFGLDAVLLLVVAMSAALASNIELLECPPPDYPVWGGYGPRLDYYTPGDTIHYFCDVDTYIGGNYLRICQDSGDWSGDTPVCDPVVRFARVEQTSTAEPAYENEAESASDGLRSTCSSTDSGDGQSWTGHLEQESQVLRVMLFLPKGPVSYEVFAVKADGTEYSCGGANKVIERYDWSFHNCLEPNNVRIVAIRIKSTTSAPLQLCEVYSHALTDPTCVDPHMYVENGRLTLTRKRATLVCDRGYRKGRDSRLDCIRTGVWTRKNLYCIDSEREFEEVPQVESQPTKTDERERERK